MLSLDRSTINVILLGTSLAFIFAAYLTMANLEKVILYGLHQEDPTFTADGYISQEIIYAAFSFFLWFGPSAVSVLGTKLSMSIGTIFYAMFIGAFFFHLTWLIYFTSFIIGLGASLLWTGQSGYILESSNENTLEKHLGIFQILYYSGTNIGNVAVFFMFRGKNYSSDSVRNSIVILLLIISAIGSVSLLILPNPRRKTKSITEPSNELGVEMPIKEITKNQFELSNDGPWKTFKKALKILITKYFLILIILFVNIGISLSFTITYNSCFGFTTIIPNSKDWVPLAGFASGVGVVVAGALPMIVDTNKYNFPLGIRPMMLLAFVCYMISYTIAYLNFPNESMFGDTKNMAIIVPNPYICLVGSLLLHMGETVYFVEMQSLLAKIFQKDAVPAYAISNFIRAGSTSLAFSLSTIYGLHTQLVLLTFLCTGSFIAFSFVNSKVRSVKDKFQI